ncbi:MAG: hypothetical protein WC608_04680 [Parcubacteria group bacterium]
MEWRKNRCWFCPKNVYGKKIGKFSGNNLIKVIFGQRRAGKSFVMRRLRGPGLYPNHRILAQQRSQPVETGKGAWQYLFDYE